MIQEYLFVDTEHKTEIENYQPEGVDIEIYPIKNSSCWVLVCSMVGETRENAKCLSLVNEYIISTFNPIVLTNESSAYYNRMLFPLINELERKLRKLLYLKSALNRDERFADNISRLEEKTLGEIFTLLFSDPNFVNDVKKKINKEMNWQFTKTQVLEEIQRISEVTTWGELIGDESVTELRNQFDQVREYRNDVMHAHNIDFKLYHKARKLFSKINEQLDEEIGKIISLRESSHDTESDFNSTLSLVLERDAELAKLSQMSLAGFHLSPELQKLLDSTQRNAEIASLARQALMPKGVTELEKILSRINSSPYTNEDE